MGHPHEILAATSFTSGTLYTSVVRMRLIEPRSIAVQFYWDAVLTATPLMQVSNDAALRDPAFDADTASWIDYSGEVSFVSPPAGGSERDGGYNVSFLGYEFVRFGMTHSAGSPNLSARLHWIK